MNTSSTGGFLKPINNAIEGQIYEDFIQQFLLDITGFSAQQVIPEKIFIANFEQSNDGQCLSYFIEHSQAEENPFLKNINENEVLIQRSFTDIWRITFHGLSHMMNAEHFEDAMHVYQNRDVLRKFGISVKAVNRKNQDLQISSLDFNHDQTVVQLALNRGVNRIYKIKNFSESIVPIEKL